LVREPEYFGRQSAAPPSWAESIDRGQPTPSAESRFSRIAPVHRIDPEGQQRVDFARLHVVPEWPVFALTGRLESTDTVLYWVKGGSFFRISTLSGACVLCVLVRH
jgi:hypothetical protein